MIARMTESLVMLVVEDNAADVAFLKEAVEASGSAAAMCRDSVSCWFAWLEMWVAFDLPAAR